MLQDRGEAEKFLEKCSLHTFVEVQTEHDFRFVFVDDEEIGQLNNDTDNFQKVNTSLGPVYVRQEMLHSDNLPVGVCVSWWKKDPKIEIFKQKDVDNAVHVFGKGFGSRDRCKNGGQLVMAGPSLSNRPLNSPDHGRGSGRYNAPYFRSYFKDQPIRDIVLKKINLAGELVLNTFREANDTYNSFVGYDTPNRGLYTGASFGSPQSNCLDVLSYVNEKHRDTKDKADVQIAEKELEELPKESAGYVHVKKIKDRISLGIPTTCGYNIVDHEDNVKFKGVRPELNAYFCQHGFCVPLRHGWAHQMFAWAFNHFTSLAVLLHQDKYQYRNAGQDFKVVIAAWGNWGSASHHRSAREKRKIKRDQQKRREEKKKRQTVANQRENPSRERTNRMRDNLRARAGRES